MKTLKNLTAAAAFCVAATVPFAAGAQALDEGFTNVSGLSGWKQVNNSVPAGDGWFQGNGGVFGAQAGALDSYIAASFLSAANGAGAIDTWLITPELSLNGASTLSFFTRTEMPGFADLIEVRFSAGSGTDTSSFTTLLSTIGGNGDFPTAWQQFSASIDFSGTGRFAFRYLGDASAMNYVGIDSVQVVTAVPEPSLALMLGLGLGALGLMRRRLGN
jgi:hypothetical protein